MTKNAWLLLALVAFESHAQPGEIRGRITVAATGEVMPFANVAVVKSGQIFTGASADSTGHYRIKPLDPGSYTVRASFVGYVPLETHMVQINSGKITFLDIRLSNDNTLPIVEIDTFRVPLVEKDRPGTMFILESGQIDNSPLATIQDMIAQSPGVVQSEESGNIHIRGSRENATQYIVDGMRIRGRLVLPRKSIAKIEVITGGIPAQFGDATGGIVIITTKSYWSSDN